MGYTHFKGVSLYQEGLAVGPKGQEKRVIDTSGKISTSGLTAVMISATDGIIHKGLLAEAVIGSGTYKELSGEITNIQNLTVGSGVYSELSGETANIQTANIDNAIIATLSGGTATIQTANLNNIIATMMSGEKVVIGSTTANNLYIDNALRLDVAGTTGSSALDHYDGYITINISGQDKKIPYIN